jgi:cell wall-associated NlpC family hydrolase
MSRFGNSVKRPMHISIAAGVAGTVAVTGTVVAVASDQPAGPRLKRVAFATPDTGVSGAIAQFARQDTVDQARHDRSLAAVKVARRKALARHKAAAKRAAAKRAAAKRAAASRTTRFISVSRSFSRTDEHLSASAGHVLQLAAAQSGDSYSYGAAGPNSFDCSGFTQYVFGLIGISLPHSAAGQSALAKPVSRPQPGDLVFVHNGGGGSISHVAIYAGGGYWYEASNPGQPVGKHPAWSTNVSFGRVL